MQKECIFVNLADFLDIVEDYHFFGTNEYKNKNFATCMGDAKTKNVNIVNFSFNQFFYFKTIFINIGNMQPHSKY